MKTKLYILLISLLVFSSCSIKKNISKNTNIDKQKNEQKFIYLFSEANKNRLLGNSQKALEFYMSAIDANPKSAASDYYVASIFFQDKDYNSALSFAEKAVKIQPANIWYSLQKADILYSKSNIDEAYTEYIKLQKQYPQKELLYERIIEILLDKIKANQHKNLKDKQVFNDLISIYKEKQKHFGFDNQIAVYLYNIYVEIKDYKNANQTLQKLILKEPNEPKYKTYQAENYIKNKDYKNAEELYKKLNKDYPDNIDVKVSYAKFCKITAKNPEYYNTVKQLLSSDLQINKKIRLIISGRYPNFPPKEYEQLLNILYKNNPNSINVNTLLSEYYIDKDKSKALPFILKATELSNGDFNLVLTLFELAYDTKNYEILYIQSKKYLDFYPNQAKVFLYNGIGAYKTKRYEEAISVLNLGKDFVIEDNVLLLQFYFYLAETYHALKQHKKSDEHFEKVLNLNPKFYLALNNYSYYLSQRKENIKKALLMAEVCIKYQTENPIFNDTYAKALFVDYQYNKALVYSKKAVKIIPNNVDFLENYGNILFALNKKEEALKNWKLSQKLGNKSEKLKNKIQKFNIIKIKDL